MTDPAQAIEVRLQATVTPGERRRAQRDAWQILQLLQLQAPIRDLLLEDQDHDRPEDGSEVA